MEELLDELQNILDSHGDHSLEVEYNVRSSWTAPETLFADRLSIEWGYHPRFGPARDVCDQQTTAEQADLALLSR